MEQFYRNIWVNCFARVWGAELFKPLIKVFNVLSHEAEIVRWSVIFIPQFLDLYQKALRLIRVIKKVFELSFSSQPKNKYIFRVNHEKKQVDLKNMLNYQKRSTLRQGCQDWSGCCSPVCTNIPFYFNAVQHSATQTYLVASRTSTWSFFSKIVNGF